MGGPEAFGEVLLDRAAPEDVEDLEPPADGQGGDAEGQGGLGQLELGGVALGVDAVDRRVGLGPVAAGVDVAPAGEDEAGERGEHLLGRRRVVAGEDDRAHAGPAQARST